MIDLHMHSTASDGTDTPVQLAGNVKAAGIQIFALTDHDTVIGAEQLTEHLPKGVTFIPGIEFSCRMPSGKCHILGYDCDMAHPAFRDALAQGAALRCAGPSWKQGLSFSGRRGCASRRMSWTVCARSPALGNRTLET